MLFFVCFWTNFIKCFFLQFSKVSNKSVTRILRTRIEPGKHYLLRYGAIQPSIKRVLSSDGKTDKESGRFYLLAKLLGAPDTVGDNHGIRMKIKQRQFDQYFYFENTTDKLFAMLSKFKKRTRCPLYFLLR